MIGYKDNADILRGAVAWGAACPNCYSTSHKDCTGDDEECLVCDHESREHCLDNTACQEKGCECSEFKGESHG